MSQRRDDTTEPPARAPGDYYYDDATGYERYDPAQDEPDDTNQHAPPSHEGNDERTTMTDE